IYSKDGKPLLSWRVLLLPFVEENARYQAFKFDEPWDSPHNVKLLEPVPKIYQLPGRASAKGGTHYQVFYSKGGKKPSALFVYDPKGLQVPSLKPFQLPVGGSVFEPQQGGLTLSRSFPDGASNTILLAEAAEAVPWTKPGDLHYEPDLPLPKL